MTDRSGTERLLREVERHSGHILRFRGEMGMLLSLGVDGKSDELLQSLLFQAKFITRAASILKREAPASEETKNLSDEFKKGVQRTADLLRELLAQTTVAERETFEESFLHFSHTGLAKLLDLCQELAFVKNYRLDHPIP